MKLLTVNTPQMDANTYLISSEKAVVVIDPGFLNDEIVGFINDNKDKQVHILLTHNHFDHILGADELRSLSGGKIYISEQDAYGLKDGEVNLTTRFLLPFTPFEADVTFKDNDDLLLSDIKVKVLVTPGHSIGSACFIIGDWLFTGDTLFRMSVGRTDFFGGDRIQQITSLKRLTNLKTDYEVFAGHGPATRLSYEKQFNPYIKEIL
ncbi:MAG: MBL fold metallo-hydrolase [Acutalibacteraceae bacterium]|nr:MBL fold metallo-hydrolase [Acutalibacteraceae bacterium]